MANEPVRIIGLDPGLRRTGWGVIVSDGARLRWVAHGVVTPPEKAPFSERLLHLLDHVGAICADHGCEEAAVEEVFVNVNPQSTLKLGQARGVILLGAARSGMEVGEYAARLVKKSVVGVGNASKDQVHAMVSRLLPGVKIAGPDAADALAVAITHAHHLASARRIPTK